MYEKVYKNETVNHIVKTPFGNYYAVLLMKNAVGSCMFDGVNTEPIEASQHGFYYGCVETIIVSGNFLVKHLKNTKNIKVWTGQKLIIEEQEVEPNPEDLFFEEKENNDAQEN